MEEIWKDIKGYEGLYQVSNLGRIKKQAQAITYIRNGKIILKFLSLKCMIGLFLIYITLLYVFSFFSNFAAENIKMV